ncbi:MAG: hypothetical protein J5498_06025 [Bacteroidales bacterium]|nr:hypothetical protein [Bacteroidales bacterium]MBR4408578.1 hypothetical protein [Bacteroidales bacterium]MBR5956252.1 hypothetical protein [Bacteroidales bacterium]
MNSCGVIVPIVVCFLLPVCIILIVSLARKHEIDKRTDVMLKAIEAGQPVDPNLFSRPSERKSSAEKSADKLQGAVVTLLLGVVFTVLFFIGNDLPWQKYYIIAGPILLAAGIANYVSYATFLKKNQDRND